MCLVVVFLTVIVIVIVFVMVIFAVFNLDVVIVVVKTIRQKSIFSPYIYNPGNGRIFKKDFFSKGFLSFASLGIRSFTRSLHSTPLKKNR